MSFYSAGGITVQGIRYGRIHDKFENPIFQIGNHKFTPNADAVRFYRQRQKLAGNNPPNAIPISLPKRNMLSTRALALDIDKRLRRGKTPKEEIYDLTNPAPANIQTILNRIENLNSLPERVTVLKTLFSLAIANGWEEVIDYLFIKIDQKLAAADPTLTQTLQAARSEFQIRTSPFTSTNYDEDILVFWLQTLGIITPDETREFTSSAKAYAANCLPSFGINLVAATVPDNITEIIRLILSDEKSLTTPTAQTQQLPMGAAIPYPIPKTIAIFSKSLSGRNRYLRTSIGVIADKESCCFDDDSAIKPEYLDEEGPQEIVFCEKEKGFFLTPPHIAGGKLSQETDKGKTYTIGSQVPPETLDLTLKEFKERAPEIYGEELYEKLTQTHVTLENMRTLSPNLAKRWEKALKKIENLPLGKAIKRLRADAVSEPSLRYKQYRKKERERFLAIKQKSDNRKCNGDEYHRMIVENGGGVCSELATMGTTLFRLAGIPTAQSTGFVVNKSFLGLGPRKRVKNLPHAFGEVLIPGQNGRFISIPIEFSKSTLSPGPIIAETIGYLLDFIENIRELFVNAPKFFSSDSNDSAPKTTQQEELKQATYQQATDVEYPEILKPVITLWQRADIVERKSLAFWMETLYMMLGNESIANSILKNPQRTIDASQYFIGSTIDYNSNTPPYMDQILHRYETAPKATFKILKWRRLFLH
ncbi:hypothetical protein A3J90_03865 [candidate division WOR-1 bacterium RIFOXYC2_FULL_37_10]|nr:MAG: hypothetical protein A3J90_03865 [candidate division WOR-1 bacterium RIFOXYC2_FULL_37_10]